MKIKVRLFATLREGRGKEVWLDLPAGSMADAVIKGLNITDQDVAILMVNGRDADRHRILVEGDYVSIFPPVGGG